MNVNHDVCDEIPNGANLKVYTCLVFEIIQFFNPFAMIDDDDVFLTGKVDSYQLQVLSET